MTTLKHKHTHHHNNTDFSDDVDKIKAAIQEASDNLKDKATELWADSIDDVKGQTKEVKKNIANYTIEKPIQSLGIALLVGMAVGYLIRK